MHCDKNVESKAEIPHALSSSLITLNILPFGAFYVSAMNHSAKVINVKAIP